MLTLTITTGLVCGFAALAGGFIDAISGGGGLLTIPALLLMGIPPHYALGTNKISAVCGTAVSICKFAANHLVYWRLALFGIGFSMAGSWFGAWIAYHLSSNMLGKIILILIPFAMLGTLLPQKKTTSPEMALTGWRFWFALPLLCLCLGCYDGFFGPGTGSFLILALHWVLKLDLLHASATAKAFNLASNISGAIYFVWNGLVFWKLGLLMAVCFMAGNWAGATFAIHLGPKAVRRFLMVSLFLLMVALVWRFFIEPLLVQN